MALLETNFDLLRLTLTGAFIYINFQLLENI